MGLRSNTSVPRNKAALRPPTPAPTIAASTTSSILLSRSESRLKLCEHIACDPNCNIRCYNLCIAKPSPPTSPSVRQRSIMLSNKSRRISLWRRRRWRLCKKGEVVRRLAIRAQGRKPAVCRVQGAPPHTDAAPSAGPCSIRQRTCSTRVRTQISLQRTVRSAPVLRRWRARRRFDTRDPIEVCDQTG